MREIDLSGIWKLQLDEKKEGLNKGYEKGNFSDLILLPGTTSIAKKGNYNEKKETGYLTEEYTFEGYAWYSKKVKLKEEDLGLPVSLYLERTRVTRVFVDGREIEENEDQNADSFCAPHRYDLTDYIDNAEFVITILVSNTDYKTKGGHMTSPDTQTNWNGIMGKIALFVYETEYLSDIRVDTDLATDNISVTMDWVNTSDVTESVNVYFSLSMICLSKKESGVILSEEFIPERNGKILNAQKICVPLEEGKNTYTAVYQMGDHYKLWDEYHPFVYELTVSGEDGTFYGKTTFGMREIKAGRHHFYVNENKIFLRGKHDGMIFPLTGAAPCELSEWLRVMEISKSYGINHYRYHTSCPPDAAFLAADLLGIYMEPELPFWGTISAKTDENYNGEEQEFLIEEGFRIMKAFGNHASFAFMSLGNELWGSSERLAEILRGYHAVDERHLYTQGSNNFQFVPCILPEDDFYVGVRFAVGKLIRGSYAMCDKPQGFVQTEKPNTVTSYDDVFREYLEKKNNEKTEAGKEIEVQFGTGTKKVSADDEAAFCPEKPVVSHEIGQYATFPNFREIDKYTGVLKARNLEVFREKMKEAGLINLAEDYVWASGKLAAQCYKLELEAAHRSGYLAGYQILDIQDFSGQGTSLVGVLDAFMENKGYITRENWRKFCSDTLIMAEMKDFVLEGGSVFEAEIMMSNYNPSLSGTKNEPKTHHIHWKIYELGHMTIDYGEISEVLVKSGVLYKDSTESGVLSFGTISLPVPESLKPKRWKLVLELDDSEVTNDYQMWIFPSVSSNIVDKDSFTGCEVAFDVTDALEKLRMGNPVVLFSETEKEYIPGYYCTEFWNYPMFKSISEWLKRDLPIGTMGLLIQENHPALSLFPTESYETPQWHEILNGCHLHILDHTEEKLQPIVQMMDNFDRSHKLGLLWETRVGDGRLLVSSVSYEQLMKSAEGKQFAKSILCYAQSEDFLPMVSMTEEELIKII